MWHFDKFLQDPHFRSFQLRSCISRWRVFINNRFEGEEEDQAEAGGGEAAAEAQRPEGGAKEHGLDLSEWREGEGLKGVPVGKANGEVEGCLQCWCRSGQEIKPIGRLFHSGKWTFCPVSQS